MLKSPNHLDVFFLMKLTQSRAYSERPKYFLKSFCSLVYLKNAKSCILDGPENPKNCKVFGVAADKIGELLKSAAITQNKMPNVLNKVK